MLRILSQLSMSQLTADLTQSPESGAHSGRMTCSWGTLVWATAARGRHAQVCSRGHGEAWLSPPGLQALHTDTHACTQTHAHSWTGTHGYTSRRPCTPPGPPGRPPHPVAVLPLTGHVQGRSAPLVGDGRALAVVDAGRARFVVELQAGRRQVQLWADPGPWALHIPLCSSDLSLRVMVLTGIKTIPMEKKCKKSKMAIWGGLTNSCEKKRSEKQRRKGKI